MKSFKDIVKETVNPPKSPDEKRFLAKHTVKKSEHPVALDHQFVSKLKKDKSKKAGYHDGEDAEVYEAADVHTRRADKKAVIVHDVDPRTGESKTTTRKMRAGDVKVEEVELDEISKKTLGSYVKKASDRVAQNKADYTSVHSGELSKQGTFKDRLDYKKQLSRDTAKRKAGMDKAIDRLTKEEVELDEISKKTLVNYMDKSKKQTADIQKKFKKGTETRDDEKTFDRRVSGQIKALDKFHGRSKVPASGVDKAYDAAQKAMRKEEVELDESITKMSHSRLKWHMNTGVPHGSYSKDEMKKERDRRMSTGEGEAYKKAKPMMEEADQIDEISGAKLGSYMVKARKSSDELDRKRDKSFDEPDFNTPENKAKRKALSRKISVRNWGQGKALDKITGSSFAKVHATEEVDLDEAVEVRHDRYMRSHGKKARDAFGGGGTWAFTHKDRGDVDYNDEKEVHTARGKFSDAKKAAQQWAKKHGHSTIYVMEEVEQIDELKRSTLASYVKKAAGVGDRNSLPNAMRDQMAAANMGDKEWYKDSQRKANKRGTGIQRAADRLAKEEVELDEAFKAGSMKLKDGSTVQLDLENAKAVNALFAELNSSNKKKMQAKMMESKTGFNEIVKFAKEAM